MLIALHKNATTTPATRRALQQASGTDRELAQQYGIGLDTVRKWRHRTTVHDASHTPHRLQTTLNAAQEELVVYLRTQLLLPLDDLLAVVREFIEPAMSRSALDRLLRRRGHSRLPVPAKPDAEHKPFKAYEPGYVHVDVKYLPQMHDEDKRRYVFVAIDRATRWVFIAIKQFVVLYLPRGRLLSLMTSASCCRWFYATTPRAPRTCKRPLSAAVQEDSPKELFGMFLERVQSLLSRRPKNAKWTN